MCVSLRTPCPPRCRLGACSSVCCWAPVPCWSRRRASLCSECVCSTTPWCSAASPSSSKHAGFLLCICFICLFLILIYVTQWSAERAHPFSAMLDFIFTQLKSFTLGSCSLQPQTIYFGDEECVLSETVSTNSWDKEDPVCMFNVCGNQF